MPGETQPTGPQPDEEAAARELYPRVRFILAKRLGAGHPDLDDLVQEVMIAALAAVRRGPALEAERLAAYVHGIIRNIVAERFRRKYREAARAAAAPPPSGLGSPPPSPLERLFVREALDHLAEGMAKLGPKQRQVFHRLLVRGEEVATVARALGLEPARVREAKHYAIKNLRDHLKSCGIDPADVLSRVASEAASAAPGPGGPRPLGAGGRSEADGRGGEEISP